MSYKIVQISIPVDESGNIVCHINGLNTTETIQNITQFNASDKGFFIRSNGSVFTYNVEGNLTMIHNI